MLIPAALYIQATGKIQHFTIKSKMADKTQGQRLNTLEYHSLFHSQGSELYSK